MTEPDPPNLDAGSPAGTSTHAAIPDPFAFLTALARPLIAAKNMCVRFVIGTNATPAAPDARASQGDAADADAWRHERDASVIERSFASEFAALIGRPSMRPEAAGTPANAAAVATPPEVDDSIAPQTIDAGSSADASPEASLSDGYAHRIVSRSTLPLAERSVPITRLPLRPQEHEITWTRDAGAVDFDDRPSRTQRHNLLGRSVRDAAVLSGTLLKRAYREEDVEGRTIALRALSRQYPAEGKEIFVEALRIGSDDERALAIDGLTSVGAHAELASALGDRVDAVAAKAALAYIGSRSRAEYRAELRSHIDAVQIDKILTLLAGIIE